ncbi:MAG: HAD-IC family P-type ATPase, partial [Myxococcota bacterium]
LTQNRLSVRAVAPVSQSYEERDVRHILGLLSTQASEQNATSQAILEDCIDVVEQSSTDMTWKCRDEIPFQSKQKYSAVLLEASEVGKAAVDLGVGQGEHLGIVLGAFERLRVHFDQETCDWAERWVESHPWARNLFVGIRVGQGDLRAWMEPDISWHCVGVVCLEDKIRPDIQEVLAKFTQRGIALKLISGDAAGTVRQVALDAGWDPQQTGVLTGADLDQMSAVELARAALDCSIFARVSPQNKKDLVIALQEQGHYVAMVGDGVNDVLALKQAELGVAMGAGSRMAKDVAEVVLLDNDFTVMPEVLAEGDTIVANVQTSAKLFLTKNVYAALAILITGFLGLAFPFSPRHVTILGFFSITLPALLIAFSRRVGAVSKAFFRDVLGFTLISGGWIALAACAAYFAVMLGSSLPLAEREILARIACLTQVVLLGLLNFAIVL